MMDLLLCRCFGDVHASITSTSWNLSRLVFVIVFTLDVLETLLFLCT